MSEDNFKNNSYKNQPTDDGKFGNYGGMFVAETLMPLILDVSNSYNRLKNEVSFRKKLQYYHLALLLIILLFAIVVYFIFWTAKI